MSAVYAAAATAAIMVSASTASRSPCSPVLHWADLPEGAVFHLAGKSSTGKTTTARVAASFDGPPDSHANWHQSDRRTGENAAIRCDRAYILNAAEKAKREDLRAVLSSITHGLVEGGSKRYAAAVT